MLMRTLLLAGLALVLLAGCGDDGSGGGKAKLAGPLTYERGGGIAGRRDRLVVQPDGSAKLTVRERTKPIRLTDAELAKLRSDLEQTDLGSLPKNSTADRPVPDAFGYRISYDGSTVTTDDPGMPKELRGLVARLGAIVDRHSS
jgi:hypothetical protein